MTCKTAPTADTEWLPWETDGEMYEDTPLEFGDHDTPEQNATARVLAQKIERETKNG